MVSIYVTLLHSSSTLKDSNSSTTLSRVQNAFEESILKKQPPAISNPWLGGGKQTVELPKHAGNFDVISKRIKPENDILYQWRLARKMEMAAESVKENRTFIANRHLADKDKAVIKGSLYEKPVREKSINRYNFSQMDIASEKVTEDKDNDLVVNADNQEPTKLQKSNADSTYQEEFLRNNRHLTTAIRTCCSASESDALPIKDCKCYFHSQHNCPQIIKCVMPQRTHCCVCVPHQQENRPHIHQASPPKISTGIQVSLEDETKSADDVQQVQQTVLSKPCKENSSEEKVDAKLSSKGGTAPVIDQVRTYGIRKISPKKMQS